MTTRLPRVALADAAVEAELDAAADALAALVAGAEFRRACLDLALPSDPAASLLLLPLALRSLRFDVPEGPVKSEYALCETMCDFNAAMH